MYCVLFEVQMLPGRGDDYFKIAAALKPELEKVEGFLHNERFSSISRENTYISFSTWESEKALVRWRTYGKHHFSQAKGRNDVFSDYRIRIGALISDTDIPPDREVTQFRFDETEVSEVKAVVLTEVIQNPDFPAGHEELTADTRELFKSVVNEGKTLELTGWETAERAAAYLRKLRDGKENSGLRARQYRIVRDYSLEGRHEAPQYFSPVRRTSTAS